MLLEPLPSKYEHELRETAIGDATFPAYIVFGIVYYLYARHVGPVFMRRQEKGMNLSGAKILFNLLIIACSVCLLNMFYASGFNISYLYDCHRPEYSTYGIRNAMYYMCMLKFVEFFHQAFVILEKRQSSIHEVYFTISSFLLAAYHVKCIGGGSTVFPFVLNLAISIVVYMFEIVSIAANIDSKYFKRPLTYIQVVQFILIQIYCIATVITDCTDHNVRIFFYLTTPDLFVVLHMFYRNFRKTDGESVKNI